MNPDTFVPSPAETSAPCRYCWTVHVGPRVADDLGKKMAALSAESRIYIEVTGVKGGEEDRAELYDPYGPVRNKISLAEYEALGVKYGHRITYDNWKSLDRDLDAALNRARTARPVMDKRRTKDQEDQRRRDVAKRERVEAEAQRLQEEAAKALEAKRPSWARAIIIAELEEDVSDSMTDYYATKAIRKVAIGWRSGSREDFRQLRHAAASFPETAHLGPDAPKEIEHRDNWSMGAGDYLKATHHYSTGWRVYSRERIPDGLEDRLPALETAKSRATTAPNGDVQVRQSMIRSDYVEVVFQAVPSRATREALKGAGFRWNPRDLCWYGARERIPEGLGG